MLNSGPREGGGDVGSGAGAKGGGQLGCLALSSSHVGSLWGAIPSERSIRHALPYIPNLARVNAEYRDCLKSASCLVGVDLEFSLACLHSDSSLFLDQHSQRDSMGVGLEWRPLRFREGSTHFGSIKSVSQASAVFSDRIGIKTVDRTLANASLLRDKAQSRAFKFTYLFQGGQVRSGWLRKCSCCRR